MPALPDGSDAIFVHGILPRSGTNFLHELLCLHPDCGSTGPIYESWFLHFADSIDRFVESAYARWNPDWGIDASIKEQLWADLGAGLLAFLERALRTDPRNPPGARRLVNRTPQVTHLGHFFRLFPRARLVILVRDGRDLVESFVRSFGGEYEPVMRKWAGAARTVVEFDAQQRGGRSRIVRYEELCRALEPTLRELFGFLDLDPARYDFAAAARAPVLGSSTFRGGAAEPHWTPLAPTAEFKPLERSLDWPADRLALFESIAGEWARALGYSAR
jgi:protein-tyrosine sulfotransferase